MAIATETVRDMIIAINGEMLSHYDKGALFAKLSDRAMQTVEIMRNGRRLEFRF